jgi:hypothetical protein
VNDTLAVQQQIMPRAQYSDENTPCLTEVACSPKKELGEFIAKSETNSGGKKYFN